jgi:hypothetical protein
VVAKPLNIPFTLWLSDIRAYSSADVSKCLSEVTTTLGTYGFRSVTAHFDAEGMSKGISSTIRVEASGAGDHQPIA